MALRGPATTIPLGDDVSLTVDGEEDAARGVDLDAKTTHALRHVRADASVRTLDLHLRVLHQTCNGSDASRTDACPRGVQQHADHATHHRTVGARHSGASTQVLTHQVQYLIYALSNQRCKSWGPCY